VKLFRPGESHPYAYVQCKSWFGRDAGVKLIRELFGVMAADQVSEGVFVTTSDFSDDARAFAAGKPIGLIDGAEFVRRFGDLTSASQREILRHVTRGDYTTPTCPSCDVKMVLRNSHTGSFWGCPHFPRCHQRFKIRSM
jgi:restriction system protein